ncbi:hypothetical protein AB670_03827 [Chryseobacterium sp. MOF25P]|uniref:hypothetical protein n=1 Tax=unclassified Chryseobacterium TaxID=2593645 RepID=UPI000805031E|nr:MULTISPECIES: hypothetical protein [unclassified Chryseobacterium]OBW39784.1 hypothetical protein AB670_03827 [Chryseobacterium sp. MOF25P]OBW44946.1 hypothetical protein AB671_02966 [Chryseobacterium sp. BGARF1]
MKFLFSFLLLLNFLCFQAQEKDSVNNEEIEDVVILGRPKVDCQKIYDNEKVLYEKQSEELKKLNFERLFDELLKLKEFRKIKSDERKIVILNPDYITIISSCGNDDFFKCKHYEKYIKKDVFEKVWNKNSYLKIVNFFDNKIIIPLIEIPFWSFEQNMKDENNYLKTRNIEPSYKGVYRDLNNKNKEFYYSSHQKLTEKLEIHLEKNKIIAENFLQLDMKIFPVANESSNVYTVIVIFKNEGQEMSRTDNQYQFKDGKWKLLKNK